jgi:hypothetical protein
MERDLVKKFHNIYNGLVENGTIKEVPQEKKNEVRERFVEFYSRYDKRLRNINRKKISVTYNDEGRIRVTCAYYGKAYGQVYNN